MAFEKLLVKARDRTTQEVNDPRQASCKKDVIGYCYLYFQQNVTNLAKFRKHFNAKNSKLFISF